MLSHGTQASRAAGTSPGILEIRWMARVQNLKTFENFVREKDKLRALAGAFRVLGSAGASRKLIGVSGSGAKGRVLATQKRKSF